MPYYNYKTKDKSGKILKNQTFAANRQELIKLLHKENLTILTLEETVATEEKFRRKLHKKIKIADLAFFAKELAVLLENGVPLIEAFDVTLKQIESAGLLKVITQIKKDVEGGLSFKDAIAKHKNAFGNIWQDLIGAGELSGQLPYIMRQIVSFLEARIQMRKKVMNALTYPALLFILAVCAIFVFVFKIIPIFEGIFDSFGSQLPALTMAVINLSKVLRQYFWIVLIALAVIIFAGKKFLSTIYGKRMYESVLFNTPVAGGFALSLSIERFTSTLGVLVKSGIPIVKALEISAKASQSVLLSERLDDARGKVMGGLPLSEGLRQTGLFSPIVVQLILVAEKTGNFSGMLEEISKYYNDNIDTFVSRFTALLEPMVLIFMAAIIGTLVIAMFLPIFKIANLG